MHKKMVRLQEHFLRIYRRCIGLFGFIAFIMPVSAFPESPIFLSLDTTGCQALMSGNYLKALAMLWNQKEIPDSAFWNFKKAIALFYVKDYTNALTCFLYSGKKDSQISPFSYEFIGDIAGIQKHTREAVESYLRAQKDSLPSEHKHAIHDKIAALVNADHLLIDTIPFLNAWKADTHEVKKEITPVPCPFMALDSLVGSTDTAALDSIIALYTDSLGMGDSCMLLARIDSLHLPDSMLSAKRLFRLSQIALSCKSCEKALSWFSNASARPDFAGTVPARVALYHQAFLENSCGRNDKTVTLLNQYKKKYGPLPEVLMALARAYRRCNQDDQSMNAYELFLKLYPKDPKANNVLWNCAWEYDQRGNFQKAIELYKKVSERKRNSSRAPDALFRIGLCNFKAGRYVRACSIFTRCADQYPDASCALASQYWKSKSCLSLNQTAHAQKQFAAVSRAAPTDYYAFRARDALSLLGNADSSYAFNTACNYLCTQQWLDSISIATSSVMSPQDSCFFDRGKKLAVAGCYRSARYYLGPLEMRYIGNLKFQLDLGSIYKLMNDPKSTFRAGRRILWRIPSKYRDATPLPVYAISYPFAFFDIIQQTVDSIMIDPFLVLGIIRQESIFNPIAVSRAGATGLMQLMPATARQVATELGEPFSMDSLSKVTPNIRYGIHYLKKLLHQFDGNIVQAIAGYNGGPPAIMRWYEKNKGKGFDLFIEDIGYDETRGYVKKVLANYWTYKILSRIPGMQQPLNNNSF